MASAVRRLCDEAIWLTAGRLVAQGRPRSSWAEYESQATLETRRRTPVARPVLRTPTGVELRVNENRFGSLGLEITNVRVLDSRGRPVDAIDSAEAFASRSSTSPPALSRRLSLAFHSARADQVVCYGHVPRSAGVTLPTSWAVAVLPCKIERLDLAGGQYFVDVGVYERSWAYAYDYHGRSTRLRSTLRQLAKVCCTRPATGSLNTFRPLANGRPRKYRTSP